MTSEATSLPIKQLQGCIGKYVGPLSLFQHCWIATGHIRDLFYNEIRPKLLRHLEGWFQSMSSEGIVVLSLYMIGRPKRSPTPTICFISQHVQDRKEARSIIKESGVLKLYPQFKTAHMAKDPSWGGELEQLAQGSVPDAGVNNAQMPVMEAYYKPMEQLRALGMPIYVRHTTSHGAIVASTRPATANAIQVGDELFYMAPCHVFFCESTGRPSLDLTASDEFEIDSDDDSNTYNELEVSMTSFGSSSSLGNSFGQYSGCGQLSSSEVLSRVNAPSQQSELEGTMRARRSALEQTTPLETDQTEDILPFEDHHGGLFETFGTLTKWSIDQDWALIKVVQNVSVNLEFEPKIFNEETEDPLDANSHILAYTVSQGPVRGTMSNIISDIRLPGS